MNNLNQNQEMLLNQKQVEEMIGFKKDFIFNRLKNNTFPKPIKFGRCNRWRLSDIQEWISQQI